jgi:anti-sigma factor RsiW
MLMPKPIHPTSRTLLAYLDGELPVDRRREVAGHLRECPDCRMELDTIEADLDWHLVLDAASLPRYEGPSAEGLHRVLAMARQWRETQPAPAGSYAEGADERGRSSVEQQVGEALELFFGTGIGSGAGDRSHGAAEEAESLLSAFLGRRVTAAMMSQLRTREKMGRFLAPDLT